MATQAYEQMPPVLEKPVFLESAQEQKAAVALADLIAMQTRGQIEPDKSAIQHLPTANTNQIIAERFQSEHTSEPRF